METKVKNTLEAFITMELINPVNITEEKKQSTLKLKDNKSIRPFEKVFPLMKKLPWHKDHRQNRL